MNDSDADILARYGRQMAFAGLGPSGQRLLMNSRVLLVGVGGMGSWSAELMVRAGVGMLRIVDDDVVDLANLHRQAMYDESDASARTAKAAAAAAYLGRVNSNVAVEAVLARLDRSNVSSLAEGMDLILDGTDNFASRLVINDYAVRSGTPWVFAGVVDAEAQTMTIVPGRTPCLRCVVDSPADADADGPAVVPGVLGPAVATIAAIQASEAIKILAGLADSISPYLLKLNLWSNTVQRIDVARACAGIECPCCALRRFEFLE